MVKLSYALIKSNHISEIIYSLSRIRNNPIIALCPGPKAKEFFSILNTNANYKNVQPITLQQYQTNTYQSGSTVVLIHPPSTFEQLEAILKRAEAESHLVLLSVLQENKKYLNIVSKKIANLNVSEMVYSPNKFVGINDKIRDLVDQSYDMNRAAFYAYGEFINYHRANLLKKIFRTELLNLDDLARSYGFTSAQRVKEGTFLKPTAQKANKAEKRRLRKQAKRNRAAQEQQNNEQVQQQPVLQKPKKTKKIVKPKVKKSAKTQ